MSEPRPEDDATEAVGAAVAPPDGAIVTSGGPLPEDDDASSPGIDAYRDRVIDRDDK